MTTLFVSQVKTDIDEMGRYITSLVQVACTTLTEFEKDILEVVIKHICNGKKPSLYKCKEYIMLDKVEGHKLLTITDIVNRLNTSNTPIITFDTPINENKEYRLEIKM